MIPPSLEVFTKRWMWHLRTWFNDGHCAGAGLVAEDLEGLKKFYDFKTSWSQDLAA